MPNSMAVAGLGFCTVVRLRQAKLSRQGSAQASSLLKMMSPSSKKVVCVFRGLLEF